MREFVRFELTAKYDEESNTVTYHLSRPGSPGLGGDDYEIPKGLSDFCNDLGNDVLQALGYKIMGRPS